MTPLPKSHELPASGTASPDSSVAGRFRATVVCLIATLALGGCGGKSKAGGSGEAEGNSAEGSTNGGSSRGSAANAVSSAVTTGGVTAQGVTSGAMTTATGFGSGGMASTTGAIPSSGGAGGTITSAASTGSGGAGGNTGMGGAAGAAGVAGTSGCEAQDVSGVGNCDGAFGVYFFGASCGWVSGCSCQGADCANGYQDEASCQHANRGCLSDCASQDATHVGACLPSESYYFNGVACAPMAGCLCVGDDCEAGYGAEQECLAAHSVCEDRVRSCEEIEAVYAEYVSHTACVEDSDCEIVLGACGVGLGGCHHAVNRRWGEDGLAVLAEAFTQGGCSGAVCDCGPPPAAAVCDNGVCAPEPDP